MTSRPAAAWSVAWKDLTATVRTPLFLALSVAVPLVFVGIFGLVIHTSSTNPVAVARHSQGPHSDALLRTLQEVRSADGPFFDVTETDPGPALAAYRAGRVPGVIHVPPDFDRRIAGGDHATVELEVFNIDSDATKNLQLRLDHALREFNGPRADTTAVHESPVFERDIPMSRYFAAALIVFSVLYLSMVNTGALVAREWEDRTAKAMVLSPLGFGPFIAGKWLAGTALTAVGLAFVLGMVAAVLGFPALGMGATAWASLAVVCLLGVALGALLGVRLKNALLLVPACAVICVTHLLLSGFESYLRGFAHDGPLRWMWQAGAWWPVSALTDDIRFDVEGITGGTVDVAALAVTAVIAAAATALAVRHLRRHLKFAQGM